MKNRITPSTPGQAWRRLLLALPLMLFGFSCDPPPEANNVDRMDDLQQASLSIGNNVFQVWLSVDASQREVGLMNVPAERMEPTDEGHHRGMLFVFPNDQGEWHCFWMQNTIIPLDIAYIDSAGTIVTIRTMAPLDTSQYCPTARYRYALEVNALLFSQLGIGVGDRVDIPEAVLNTAQ